MLAYKGYRGHVEFDEEAGVFHGEVLDTRDVITFEVEQVGSTTSGSDMTLVLNGLAGLGSV